MEVVTTSKLFSTETEKTATVFYSSFHNGRTVKKNRKKHIPKRAKSKPTSNELKEKILFSSKMHSFANNLIIAIES